METQPKKRGRKKKIQAPEPVEPVRQQSIIIDSNIDEPTVKPVLAIFNNKNNYEKKEERRQRRIERNKELSKCAENIDLIMNSKKFLTDFKDKFVDEFYYVHKKIEKRRQLMYLRNLDQIERRCLADTTFEMLWRNVITYEVARKLIKIIGFLLENGPMTRIEEDIFDDSVEIIKNYYNSQNNIIQESNSGYTIKGTYYFPSPQSNVYKFLFEVLKLPTNGASK